MSTWTIVRDWPAKPVPGSDRDAAFAFELAAPRRVSEQVTVEYAAPSSLASLAHARSVVSAHLDDKRPPRRLIVDRDGAVHISE
jgi:hypothetical protein